MDKSLKIPEKVRELFESLGLADEEIAIYFVLVRKGVLTTLELARSTGVSRTQVYRLLEKMKEKGLVEEIVDEHRLMARAVDFDQIEKLIKDKKVEMDRIEAFFPEVKQLMLGVQSLNQPDTQVKFYRGKSGILQMAWNVLQAKDEIVGFTYRSWESAIGKKYERDFYEEMVEKKIKLRDVYSDAYVVSFDDPVAKIEGHHNWPTRSEMLIESRYISSKVLDISCQSDIYNEVVSFYNWYEGEVFGVEIYNARVARMQRQLFDLVWERAEPEEDLLRRLKKKS